MDYEQPENEVFIPLQWLFGLAILAAAVIVYIMHTAHHLEMHRIGFEKRNGQWVKQIEEPKQ